MERKICPICDLPIRGIYCRNCRQFIRHPQIREMNYYLNESHPEKEDSCDYHDDHLEKEASRRLDNVRQFQEKTSTNRYTGRNGQAAAGQKTSAQTRSAQKPPARTQSSWNTSGKQGAGKNNTNKKNSIGVILIIIVIIVNILPSISGALGEIFYEAVYRIEQAFEGSKTPETKAWETAEAWELEEDWQVEVPEEPDVDMSFIMMEEEEVISLGQPCTSRKHIAVNGKKLEQDIKEILEANDFVIEDSYDYSDNYIYTEEENSTTFNKGVSFSNLHTDEYIDLSYDTVSQELHSISGKINDRDRAIAIAENLIDLLNKEGGFTGAIDQQLLDELEKDDIGVFENEGYYFDIMKGNKKTYYIYFGANYY